MAAQGGGVGGGVGHHACRRDAPVLKAREESSILSFLAGGGWRGWRSGRAKREWAAVGGPVGPPVEYDAARRGGRGSPMAARPVETPMVTPIPSPAPPPPSRERILLRLAMGHPEALRDGHRAS